MKKTQLLFFIVCIALIQKAQSQCINTTAYGTAIINSCSNGTITTCNWASEYSELTFNTTGSFTFGSSISSDWLTLTDATNNVIAFGSQPLTITISLIGNYRLHVSTDFLCGTQNTCRITSYSCSATATPTSCVNLNPYGTATINSYGTNTITNCNYAGEYSQLTISALGNYTFASSNSTDFLTLTDAANNVLLSGNTPLVTNINTSGNYRLHVSISSACGTDNICRVTTYTCAPNVPCSGTPNAGTTTISSSTICSGQTISCSLIGSTVASGLTYQWQSSANSTTWVNVTGQTNASMNQYVTTSIYYRCIVSCSTNTSASVPDMVFVASTPIAGNAMASSTTTCFSNSIYFSLTGNSTWPGISYQWQSSSDNANWFSISGEINSTMNYAPTTSVYIRCVLTCGASDNSTSVYVTTPSATTYAALPFYETFDNTWVDGCDIHNLPNGLNWQSFPTNGNTSWRRQDDGFSAGWSSSSFGIEQPYSGNGCANFHSTQVPTNQKGDLSVYVNMSAIGKYAISFYYINPTGNDNLTVQLSDNAGTSYSNKAYYNAQNVWAKKIIYYNSTASAPSSIIRFRGEGVNQSNSDDIAIDSLSVKFICANPNIVASSTSPSICAGQSATLSATGASNYTWMPGSVTGSVIVVSPTNNTNYVVTATNDGHCFTTLNLPIMVSSCPLGIEQVFSNEVISVYPNPTADVLTIDFDNAITETKLLLFNSIGQLTETIMLDGKKNNISLRHLSAGLYTYQLKMKEKTIKNGVVIKQ